MSIRVRTAAANAPEAERELDRLLRNVNAIILEGDPFHLTFVGGQVQRILGYSADQWLADPNFWESHLHPKDRRKAAGQRDQAVRLGRDHTLTYRMIGADGRTVWLLDTATVTVQKGVPVRMRMVMVDVTEWKRSDPALRESEERFRRLAALVSDGIALHEGGRILDANEALAKMFGYSRPDLVGLAAVDLAPPEFRHSIAECIRSGDGIRHEAVGRRKDGSTFPIELATRLVPYEGRNVRIVVMREVTAEKMARDARRQGAGEPEATVRHESARVSQYRLTGRELTVLHLVTEGLSDKAIASELLISHQTVSKHITNILAKMKAASRTEASVRALREGLLD